MKLRRRQLLALPLLLLASTLAGCGFELVGDRPVPPALNSVYIDVVQPYRVGTPPLETALQSKITARGGTVKSHLEDAKSVLRVSNLIETRETLSIGPDGLANEYRLVTSVTYELHSGSQILIAPEQQGVSRSYSFSVNEVLGKEAEEGRLRNYMQDELATLILLRIDAALSQSSPENKALPKPAEQPAAAPVEPPAPAAVPRPGA
jgi:LPS-assembly lipoprotein